jgi:RNase P/RNase MRP subunit p29
LYKGNLLGKFANITFSKDPSLKGIRGLIVEESRNMLRIEGPNKKMIGIPKSIVIIDLQESMSKSVTVQGENLVGTPAERIKS